MSVSVALVVVVATLAGHAWVNVAVGPASAMASDDWSKILTLPEGVTDPSKTADVPEYVVPSARQLLAQNRQFGAFLHFGLPTYAKNNQEYYAVFPGKPNTIDIDPSRFNPNELDAEQWVLTAKSFGAKQFVFTAKHHDGFCLWPTETTEYCIRNTPWKGGKGDLVREVAEACRKHGMPLGLYCSPADKHQECYCTHGRTLVGDREKYFSVYRRQLTELMTGYGKLVEVWFDGYLDPFGCDVRDATTGKVIGSDKALAMVQLVRELQPGAVVHQSRGVTSDIRHAGSEHGVASYPLWNIIHKGEGHKAHMSPEAEGWFLPEANMYTRPRWLWQPNTDPHLASVERLVEAYYTSIGNGANLLMNLTPDTRGLIPDVEVQRMADFGAELRRRFGKALAKTDSGKEWTRPGTLELDLGRGCLLHDLVLEEEIAQGQHVLVYEVDVLDGGKWNTVAKGQSIGRKRVSRLEPPVRAEKVRLRVLQANAMPTIRTLAVYGEEIRE